MLALLANYYYNWMAAPECESQLSTWAFYFTLLQIRYLVLSICLRIIEPKDRTRTIIGEQIE